LTLSLVGDRVLVRIVHFEYQTRLTKGERMARAKPRAPEGDKSSSRELDQARKLRPVDVTLARPAPVVIDTNKRPSLFDTRWKVKKHNKLGILRVELIDSELVLDGRKVSLLLSPQQENGVLGVILQRDISVYTNLNACVLEFLLKHPYFIPRSWQDRLIFFWGTEYEYQSKTSIRHLFSTRARWYGGVTSIDNTWGAREPAAILVA